MSSSAIVGRAWELYKHHWQHFLVIALAFYLVLSLVTALLAAALGLFGVVIGAVVSLVGVFWLQGALTEAVNDVRDGRADLSVVETFRRVQPRLGALLGAGLLAGLGILVGFALLVIPGFVLLTWWIALIPVVVLERRGVLESFGRSRELVRGHGWSVFGVIVLTLLIVLVANFVIGLVIGLAFSWAPDAVRSFVGNVVGGSLTAPLGALAWTLTYFELRERKEAAAEAAPAAATAV
jgi:Uncharacterised protein family (UPF0259)